jgi:hypothetical protein
MAAFFACCGAKYIRLFRLCLKTRRPHDGPEWAWLRGVATKQYLNTTARSENDADMPVPAHPAGGTEPGASASSRPLEGSYD